MTTVAPLTRTDLWEHQRDAVEFALARPGALLAHGMGSGKSLSTIATLEASRAQRVLVAAPKSVVDVWPDQFAQHAGRDWHIWAGQVQGARGPLKNPSVDRRATACVEQYRAALRLDRPYAAIVNYEAAWQGDMADVLLGTPWDTLVIDESHRVKAPGGKASKLLARIAAKVRDRGGRVLLLTGTPMPHTPLDLWAQLRAIDGGERLGTSYHRFQQHFGAPEEVRVAGGNLRTVYKGLREDRREDFERRVADVMHHVTTADVIDLPDAIDTYVTFDLRPAARRVYTDLERDMLAELDAGGVATAANAMVLPLRLAQVTSGYLPDADTGEPRPIDAENLPEKILALEERLGDIDPSEPVVVFCRFRRDLDNLRELAARLGRTYGELSGRSRDGMDGPRMASHVTLLGAQLQAGGVGVDLTRAAHAVFYSLDFKLADHAQARARVHRPGQTRPVVYHYLLARDTVDWAIFGALRRREEIVDAVIAALRERSGAQTPNKEARP
jgi:SNF2 family DNA or RNA helicase